MSADLARDVLVHWALPLLARARRMADDLADTHRIRGGSIDDGAALVDPGELASAELLAEDIAALIGHGVTDQPPADELAEVLAGIDRPRSDTGWAARSGTAERFREIRDVARSAAPRKEQGSARRVACDGCGARPEDDVRCLAPDGRHTWRPLPTEPRIAGVAVGPGVDPAEARALMDQLNTARGHASDARAVHVPTRHDCPAHTLAPCPTDGAPCIRWCPGRQRCTAQASKSRESAPRTPLPEAFAPRPPRCPTCGARP